MTTLIDMANLEELELFHNNLIDFKDGVLSTNDDLLNLYLRHNHLSRDMLGVSCVLDDI